MPLVATRGAASAQGFGEFARVTPPIYIEDVFSTYLYTGTGSSQTITNGIDLSGKGGLVWLKSRNNPDSHYIVDTARGSNKVLYSNLTIAEETLTRFSSFNSNGFSLSTTPSNPNVNGYTYASWTFREQAKFFDVVTYTGNGNNSRQIAHNLGSSPGFVIIKRTDAASDWYTFHRSITSNQYPRLNGTDQDPNYSAVGNPSLGGAVNSTNLVFASAGTTTTVNINNATYVAYLFAHDAGGFGASGSDNVISCGSFTDSGADQSINLGYEPQWILVKRTNISGDWWLVDNMRGMPVSSVDATLKPNTSDAEQNAYSFINPEATGFRWITGQISGSGQTFIYIAIRRGPMKTPTSGTSVFAPVAVSSATSTGTQISNSFVVDAAIAAWRDGTAERGVNDRLRGISTTNPTGSGNPFLRTNTTGAETTPSNVIYQGDGKAAMLGRYFAGQGYNQIYWLWGRAPGFFDVVCYTGNGTTSRDVTHNLGVQPELVIVKSRSAATTNWVAGAYVNSSQFNLWLNSTVADGSASSGGIAYTQFSTASNFRLSATGGVVTDINTTSATYVAYLFATVGGVSKVGSYTGTGALQTVNCGFTSGARFVLIKRTDSTGDWYVWDSARGISSSTDPYLTLNTTAAEVTSTNWVDTASTGFQVTAAGGNLVNTNGGTYIFLAIA